MRDTRSKQEIIAEIAKSEELYGVIRELCTAMKYEYMDGMIQKNDTNSILRDQGRVLALEEIVRSIMLARKAMLEGESGIVSYNG